MGITRSLLTLSMEEQSSMQIIQWHQSLASGRLSKSTEVPVVILWEQLSAYMVHELLFYCIILTRNKWKSLL